MSRALRPRRAGARSAAPAAPAARALLAAALLLLAPLASAEERRCRELGATCYCSEPLDNADAYRGVHDPSDSTTRPCGVFDAAKPGRGTTDFPVRLPSGATARHVLFVPEDDGIGKLLVWPPPPPLDLTGKTFCVRSYRSYGRDHAPPGNFKIARVGGPEGTAAWQSAWTHAGGAEARPGVSWIDRSVDCHLGTTGSAAEQVAFPDCQSHWCRFEICTDHDAATGETRVRAQWSQVGGAKRMESRLGAPGQYGPDCAPERSATATIAGGFALAEFASVCCPATPGGAIYLSHVMASYGRYDPGFWIGPAAEVEGPALPPP